MLLARNVRGVGIWRTIYYMPAVSARRRHSPFVALDVQPVQRTHQYDPESFIEFVRFGETGLVYRSSLVLPSYVIMGMWGIFGTTTVILLAGLKNVPRELYDAATVDGAACWVNSGT